MNILLLIIGCFLEVVGTLLLVMPILTPVLIPLGVNPMHFGIIFTHNMEVGLVHPPVGLNLYVLSTISDAPIGEVIRGIFPFLILLLLVLAADHLLAGADDVAARSGVRAVSRPSMSLVLRCCAGIGISRPMCPYPQFAQGRSASWRAIQQRDQSLCAARKPAGASLV